MNAAWELDPSPSRLPEQLKAADTMDVLLGTAPVPPGTARQVLGYTSRGRYNRTVAHRLWCEHVVCLWEGSLVDMCFTAPLHQNTNDPQRTKDPDPYTCPAPHLSWRHDPVVQGRRLEGPPVWPVHGQRSHVEAAQQQLQLLGGRGVACRKLDNDTILRRRCRSRL